MDCGLQAGGNPGGSSWGDGQRLADEGGELGRVCGLGTTETVESRGGVSGTGNTGAWEDTGDPGRHTGSSGAGESREERGRTRELEYAKRKINWRFKVQSTIKKLSCKTLSYYRTGAKRTFLPRTLVSAGSCRQLERAAAATAAGCCCGMGCSCG